MLLARAYCRKTVYMCIAYNNALLLYAVFFTKKNPYAKKAKNETKDN